MQKVWEDVLCKVFDMFSLWVNATLASAFHVEVLIEGCGCVCVSKWFSFSLSFTISTIFSTTVMVYLGVENNI